MAREKSPAFQFYPRDWLSDPAQASMSAAGAGAYIRLLCYCWLDHTVPSDLAVLARLAGMTPREWARVAGEVLAAFDADGASLRHRRLDKERGKQKDFSAQQSGRARARWEKRRGGAGTMPDGCRDDAGTVPGQRRNDALSSSSSSSSSEEDPLPPDSTADFRTAWDAHPHTPKVQEWTDPRRAAIRRALHAKRDLMRIFQAFDASGFLCGTRPRGEGHESFRATVDWCLKPANLVKILEGAYADPERGPARTSRVPRPPTAADAYGWCDHEPRCGTTAGHDLKLARAQREAEAMEQPA